MTFKKFAFSLIFISSFVACKTQEPLDSQMYIIPIPLSSDVLEGSFLLDDTVGLVFGQDFSISANFLANYLETGGDINLKQTTTKKTIRFIKDETIVNSEGYKLTISPSEIAIHAKTDQGAFYAIQSLRQLLPVEFENGTFKGEEIPIPSVIIEDEPQFKYRGMHLDVGRHMFSVDFIKKYIDALAMLKMNTFHWHLTEDQGWRIEIKKYPKLQEIAAYRNETLKGHYSDQPHEFDGEKYGGYYTQEEIKDVVSYARGRFVTIIPEIELPGHSQAALAAYPELGCTGEQIEVATKWGVFEDIYCTKEETFRFLENVLDEVLALFPSEYIHIGGDEAPKTRWKNCNHCQKLIKKEGLKDEHELQNYFITRIETYLNSKGRQIIGWDEILEGGLAPNATVMSWRGTNGAIEAAKQHHNVIMTPTSHCYFDYYQSENDNEPLAIGGYLPLEKVYHFNPIPKELDEEETQYVLGAQGNIWTEYMSNSEQVEYMAFPRILAMSEVVWSNQENKSFPYFITRVENFHKRLDALSINYANHLYEIEGEVKTSDNQIEYHLQSVSSGKTIRFTLDNSEPTITSRIYYNFIPITESTNIKAAVFNSEENLGTRFSQNINFHEAIGKKISIDKAPNQAYSGSGAEGLINGINGSDTRYGDKEWLGFWGEDIEITIDLGKETKIDSIATRFHNGNGQWIYAPKYIEVSFDGNKKSRVSIPDSEELLINVSIKVKRKVKEITMIIPNYGLIKKGKQGAGNKAWTFIDEIIIN